MSLERKPLYLTLDSVKQFVLPHTASAVGYDLTNSHQLYFNTGSGNWEQITNIATTASFALATPQFTDSGNKVNYSQDKPVSF
jgi:hypothetical protein